MQTDLNPTGVGTPALQPYEVERMGIDPSIPYIDLDLAGSSGFPSPDFLARHGNGPFGRGAAQDARKTNVPTFSTPDHSMPRLERSDLSNPDFDTVGFLQSEPYTGDLLQAAQPLGLDIFAAHASPLRSDPIAPGLDDYDHPADLAMPGPLMTDPDLPDLLRQQPAQLDLQAHMDGRPGELAGDALATMHGGADYAQLGSAPYRTVYMDIAGVNSARRRHMDLRMRGLDSEED